MAEKSLKLLVALIALEHVGFLWLEMFAWRAPIGMRVFHTTAAFAEQTAALAANQGLYNGFLSAGLFWSLCAASPELARPLQLFFLTCVCVAGVYGGATVGPKVFFIQGAPALLALALRLAR